MIIRLASPTREACLHFSIQSFYRGSTTWVWLSDYLGSWSQLPGGLIPGDSKPLALNHVVFLAWLRLSGVASPTLKSIVTGSHPKQRYSYEVWLRRPPRSCRQRPDLSLGQVRFFTTHRYFLRFHLRCIITTGRTTLIYHLFTCSQMIISPQTLFLKCSLPHPVSASEFP